MGCAKYIPCIGHAKLKPDDLSDESKWDKNKNYIVKTKGADKEWNGRNKTVLIYTGLIFCHAIIIIWFFVCYYYLFTVWNSFKKHGNEVKPQ